MRKITLFIHSTFNGIVTGDPSKDKTNFMVWASDASMETGSEYLLKVMDTVDTVLLGRRTYEDLARKWPLVADWPGVNDLALRLGEKVNNASKLVVTRNGSLDDLKWGRFAPPKRLTGNIEEQISDLKNGTGGDIIIFGSPTLVQSMAKANLIDEYQVQVHPVVVNVGERLFDSVENRIDFHLVSVKPLADGSTLVRYAPAKA